MFCRTDLLALSQKLFSTVMMKEGEGDCVTKSYRLQRVRRDGGEKSLGWGDLDLECSLWWPPALHHPLQLVADRCHLADVKFGPQMTTSSMVKKPLLIIFYFVTVKHMMEEVRKLSEVGIALEFRQSFCSQAFPLLASPHNDIQTPEGGDDG